MNMLSETELRILSAFFPEGAERTTREIEYRSGYSHERAYTTLNSLAERGILLKKSVGKALVYSINKFDDVLYLAFAYYRLNRKSLFAKRYPIAWNAIEEFINKAEPKMAVLFGSYSRGEAKGRSDVDILCVAGRPETEKIALSMRHKYNLKISPVINREQDFGNIKSENPELWAEIVNFGIALKGQELFYELIYRRSREQ